eukprot:COSAG01_NODE_6425_length_3674_cov_4.169790_1_plen_96_part_00
MLSGHAQAPIEALATPTKAAGSASYFGNPFSGPCRAGTAGHADEANVTVRRQGGSAICAPACGCDITKPGTPVGGLILIKNPLRFLYISVLFVRF